MRLVKGYGCCAGVLRDTTYIVYCKRLYGLAVMLRLVGLLRHVAARTAGAVHLPGWQLREL